MCGPKEHHEPQRNPCQEGCKNKVSASSAESKTENSRQQQRLNGLKTRVQMGDVETFITHRAFKWHGEIHMPNVKLRLTHRALRTSRHPHRQPLFPDRVKI